MTLSRDNPLSSLKGQVWGMEKKSLFTPKESVTVHQEVLLAQTDLFLFFVLFLIGR